MSPFTIVVVLHDSGPELAALLPTLDRHAAGAQLVVVDTGSRDDGPQLARAHGAELVELPDNPGFGAANNAGIALARHDVTVLLNPDTELVDDSLHELAALARIHPRALHAPRLLEPDGSVQRSAHPLPGTVGALLPALVHPPLLPRALRDRAEPYRVRAPPHGRLGDRRVPGGPHRPAARARPVRPRRAPVRGGHGARPARPRPRRPDRPAPAPARAPHRRPQRSTAAASRTPCSPAAGARPSGRRSDRAPARSTTLAQLVTFATRIAARAALRRDASRERAQLAALRREIGS